MLRKRNERKKKKERKRTVLKQKTWYMLEIIINKVDRKAFISLVSRSSGLGLKNFHSYVRRVCESGILGLSILRSINFPLHRRVKRRFSALDKFNIVGGIESNTTIHSSFAPPLLIFVFQLDKCVARPESEFVIFLPFIVIKSTNRNAGFARIN